MQKQIAAAVQFLYGKGIIKKDKDIADRTGYNKATVSSYISGRTTPSADFIAAFEKAFRLKVSDFGKGGALEPIPVQDPVQVVSERIIQIYAISRVNQSLLVEILSHQTGRTIMELQRVVNVAMDAELKQLLAELKLGQ